MTPRDMVLAALTSAVWGLAFVATKLGIEDFSAPQLAALRFLIAALPVFVVPRPAVPWRLLLLVGLTLFAGQFFLLFLAFRHGMPPGLAAVTQQSHVFFTVLLAAVFLGERPGRRQGAAMALAAAGLALIGLTVGKDLPPAALVLALSGALSWGRCEVQIAASSRRASTPNLTTLSPEEMDGTERPGVSASGVFRWLPTTQRSRPHGRPGQPSGGPADLRTCGLATAHPGAAYGHAFLELPPRRSHQGAEAGRGDRHTGHRGDGG